MNPLERLIRYIGEFVEELILLGIIILNILDFLEVINPDWDYAKKIISWTALAYLIYKASLTKLFFGTRNKRFDFLLILSYFLLSFKNLVGFSRSAIDELREKGVSYWANLHPVTTAVSEDKIVNISSPLDKVDLNSLQEVPLGGALDNLTGSFTIIPEIPLRVNEIYVRVTNDVSSTVLLLDPKFLMHRWHNFLWDNLLVLQKVAVIAGLLLILFMAFYFTLRFRITPPSLMHVIQEEGDPPSSLYKFLVRFCVIFIVLNFFYIAVFNLTMEWLALAVDAPLLVTGAFFYLLIWIKHHKRFSPESVVYKIGNLGESFFERFIHLFYSQKGIFLGISGMLVLHMLTDIGNFILPYSIGIQDPMYFNELGTSHTPVFSLNDLVSPEKTSLFFSQILHADSLFDKFSVGGIYIFNIIALLLVFLGPAFLWYIIFKNKFVNINSGVLSLFFASMLCFILAPIFNIGRITSGNLVGVDITTQTLSSTTPLATIMLVSVVMGIMVYLLCFSKWMKSKLILGSVAIVLLFFGLYIYFFFIDTGSYYVNAIVEHISGGELVIGSYFLLFLTLTIVFYVGGFFIYLYEIFKS